jgi:polar amino acid transport system substrate-binding protein
LLLTACDQKEPEESQKVEEPVANESVFSTDPSPGLITICYTHWGIMGDEDLPKKGVYPYVVTKVMEHAGYNVRVDLINWTRCVEATKNQEYDIVAALWESKPLSKDFVWLNNSIVDKMSFFTNVKTGIDTGEMIKLKGKSVAIVRDAGGTENFYSREDWFKVYKVTNQVQVLDMILNGRADLTIAEERQFNSLVMANHPEKADQIKMLSPPVETNYASPAMSVNHPRFKEISEKYDASYRQLVKEGLYDELESVFKVKFEGRPLKP